MRFLSLTSFVPECHTGAVGGSFPIITARIQILKFSNLFSSSKFSFKGTDFINSSFIVLEYCASNCYCSNLCKTGTSMRKSLLVPSVCELLYESLLNPCCGQSGKVFYRPPWHNTEDKNHTPPTHDCPFIHSYHSWGQNGLLTTSRVFYKLSISHLSIFGLQIDLSTCLWTKTPGSRNNNDLVVLSLRSSSVCHNKTCVALISDMWNKTINTS